MVDQAQTFNQYRPLLFSIAYRLLGSAMDAEDMVQESWLRWQKVESNTVDSPKAYLSTVITRLCLDQLKSARAQREVYIGPWLPEPLLTENLPGETDELADSLSMAFLVVLENLSPLERAVFLLREVFDYDYPEIAAIVEKSEANCRQMVHRAHQHIAERRPRYQVSTGQRNQTLEQFMRACAGGDLNGLLQVLTENVVLRSDGGGKVTAARQPIYGTNNVARFILGVMHKMDGHVLSSAVIALNGQPGAAIWIDGYFSGIISVDITPQGIREVLFVVNPDKLQRLGTQLQDTIPQPLTDPANPTQD